MELLVFDLRGGMAHFRRPDTVATHASYPFITRTALRGLVASVLGLERLPEDPLCGIQLLAPVRSVAHEMSLLGKGWTGDGGPMFNRPTAAEFLVNPAYRIYYSGPEQEELAERIRSQRSHYHTYLGSAFCLTFPEFVNQYSGSEARKLALSANEKLSVCGVVPSSAVARLAPREHCQYARVSGMLHEHIGERRFRGSVSVIYEVNGGKVSFWPAADAQEQDTVFCRMPNDEVIPLW